MMKKINAITTLALIVFSIGCNQTTSNKEKIRESETVQKAQAQKVKTITYQTVESLLEQADKLSGQTVNVSGIIEHVCKHGGKRFKILSTDGSQELKIELGESFDAIGADIIGYTTMVTGILIPNNMDAEMVKAWKKKAKKNHAGEEDTEHFKQEIAEILQIHKQITTGEIPYYTAYTVQAEKYELQE
ncbi:hypothetical protein DMA11_14900 [Marinilabiliaceae bacterium JC017]|nr:hypothetical protein DMA11_14900 [Marinilabiliaceae bacterium JC017]